MIKSNIDEIVLRINALNEKINKIQIQLQNLKDDSDKIGKNLTGIIIDEKIKEAKQK